MSDERRSEFEHELVAGLKRAAPAPRRETLGLVMDRVTETPQRARRLAALAPGTPAGGWSRALAYGLVGATALVVGVAIGTSGLLPSGDRMPSGIPSSPPDASAPSTASSAPSEGAIPVGWTEIVLPTVQDGADVSIEGGLDWRGGAVLTGSAYPPAAMGGFAVAWYSTDGRTWERSTVEATASAGAAGIVPRRIGPVVDAGSTLSRGLVAFGSGQREDGLEVTVVYESADGGATWTVPPQQLPAGGIDATIVDVVSFGRELVAVGATSNEPTPLVWTSSDGRTWEEQLLAGPNGSLTGVFTAIATDRRQLVMLGNITDRPGESPRPTVMISLDARTWTVGELPANETAQLRDLVYFAQVWHAVGSEDGGPASWWSADGFGWREIPISGAGAAQGLVALGIGSEGLVAVGDDVGRAVAWRSIDGQRWESGDVLSGGASLRVVLSTTSGVLVGGTTTGGLPKSAVAWLRASAAPVAWEEPASYSFVFNDRRCGGGERDYLGTFRVHVVEGTTVSYEALDETAERFEGAAGDIPTLGELVELLRQAQTRPEASVEVSAHPIDGHPTRIYIDWITQAIDDEECYVISEYVPDG
jgi:hypothetical protein